MSPTVYMCVCVWHAQPHLVPLYPVSPVQCVCVCVCVCVPVCAQVRLASPSVSVSCVPCASDLILLMSSDSVGS